MNTFTVVPARAGVKRRCRQKADMWCFPPSSSSVVVLDFLVRTIIPRTKDEDDYENAATPTTALPRQNARGTEPSGHLERKDRPIGRAKHGWAGRSLARHLHRAYVHMALPSLIVLVVVLVVVLVLDFLVRTVLSRTKDENDNENEEENGLHPLRKPSWRRACFDGLSAYHHAHEQTR